MGISDTVAHTHFDGFKPELGGYVAYFTSQQLLKPIIECLKSTIWFVIKTLFLSVNGKSLWIEKTPVFSHIWNKDIGSIYMQMLVIFDYRSELNRNFRLKLTSLHRNWFVGGWIRRKMSIGNRNFIQTNSWYNFDRLMIRGKILTLRFHWRLKMIFIQSESSSYYRPAKVNQFSRTIFFWRIA